MNPKSVDLRPSINTVEDQGSDEACTGYGGAKALDIMYERAGIKKQFASEFLWYQDKQFNGYPMNYGNNSAQYFGSIFSVLENIGICEHSFYPDTTPVGTKPSPEATADAAKHKALSHVELHPKNLEAVKTALAQGYPVVAGLYYWSVDWDVSQGPWRTHLGTFNGRSDGGHCMTIIGYDDDAQRLLIQNSFGPNVGDGGFMGYPYELMTRGGVFRNLGVIIPDVPVVNAGYTPDPVDPNPRITPDQLAQFNQHIQLGLAAGQSRGIDGRSLAQKQFVDATNLARGLGFSDEVTAGYLSGMYSKEFGDAAYQWMQINKYFG